MWIYITFITLFFCSVAKTLNANVFCEQVLSEALLCSSKISCYDSMIGSCTRRGRLDRDPNFYLREIEPSHEVDVTLGNHTVRIPPSALRMSRGRSDAYVRVLVTLLHSSFFETNATRVILDESVLVVKAGTRPVQNLSDPVQLLFKPLQQGINGVCVFWNDSDVGLGDWSTDGCNTYYDGANYICSCNHLSFFAILVNPAITVDEGNALNLTYISYIGSAISVFFTLISFFICICLHRQRPEKAVGIHVQLAASMLCLHLSFLVSSLFLWFRPDAGDGALCKALGLLLHWSLLATLSWVALEGFHLYLLLVRVFNIYVRRYVLKISLFGWGLPSLVAAVCITADVYGKGNTDVINGKNQTSLGQMCWISSSSPHSLAVRYVTAVAFPGAVVLYNGGMLARVVWQLWGLRRADRHTEGSRSRRTERRERMRRLWKDAVTVLGLTSVLGLPWGLASVTFSTPGVYVFTVFSYLQGFILFLWCLALRSKSRSETNSSVREQLSSSQKMIDTHL